MLPGRCALGGVEVLERGGDVAECGELREGFRLLADAPDEVKAAPGHELQRANPERGEARIGGGDNGRLQRECAFGIHEGIRGIVEVYVFEIEMAEQRLAIPQRAVEFRAAIQPARQLFDRQRLAMARSGFRADGEIDRQRIAARVMAEKLAHSRAHAVMAAIGAAFL